MSNYDCCRQCGVEIALSKYPADCGNCGDYATLEDYLYDLSRDEDE